MARQISKRMSVGYWSLLAVLFMARTSLAERPAIEWMVCGRTGQACYSPDGQTLASGSAGNIKLWRVADGGVWTDKVLDW